MNNPGILLASRNLYCRLVFSKEVINNLQSKNNEYNLLVLQTTKNQYVEAIYEELLAIKSYVYNRTLILTYINTYDLNFLKSLNPYSFTSINEIGELYSYYYIYKANMLYETQSSKDIEKIISLATKGLKYLQIPRDQLIWNKELIKLL